MLSSIPNTFMFLLCVGWTSVRPERATVPAQTRVAPPARMPVSVARAY
jgi:hypothetical protein